MRGKIWFFIIIFTALIFTQSQPAEAMSYYNARAFALGGAYTAIVDDYSAMIYNPAGLAHTGLIGLGLGSTIGGETENAIEVISGVRNVLADPEKFLEIDIGPASIEYGHLTGVRFGTLGAGVSFQGRGEVDDTELNLTHYNAFNLAYAYRVLEPFGDVASLSLGFNAKYLEGTHYKYSINNNEVIEDLTDLGSGFGVDFGIMIKLTDIINIGARVENVIKPFPIEENVDYIKGGERVYTVGAGVNFPIVGLTATTDLSTIPHQEGTAFRAGLEKRFFMGLFALRAGIALEGADTRYYTGGIGLNIGPVKSDLGIGFEDGKWNEPSAVFGIRANF